MARSTARREIDFARSVSVVLFAQRYNVPFLPLQRAAKADLQKSALAEEFAVRFAFNPFK